MIATLLVGSASAAGTAADGNVVYVPLPSRVVESDLLDAHRRAPGQLDARIARHVRRRLGGKARRPGDVVVILTQPDGEPILPELAGALKGNGNGHGHGSPGGTPNELAFTFESPLYPWSAAEVAAISAALDACYPVVKEIYGSPAFAITVNVRHDPTLSFDGTYDPSLNEMTLFDALDASVACHEMIHAFRDDYVVGPTTFEEGMTRAAEIEVFDRLAPAYVHSFDQNHGYVYDVFYEALNRPAIGSSAGFFAGYVAFLVRYQLAGYAWGKGIIENPRFLADFNARLYGAIASDPTVRGDESALKSLVAAAQPTLEGRPFEAWYAAQCVLDTRPPAGYQLYQRVNQFTVDFFSRDAASGRETMQRNVPVSWALYDDADELLGGGTDVTSANGFIEFSQRASVALGRYAGRVKVVASAATPDGPIVDTAYTSSGDTQGVFGVVADASEGTVTITPLANPVASVMTDVVRGAFAAPGLQGLRGRFAATFEDETGRRVSRQFTKDASDYFLSIALSDATADLDVTIVPDRRNVKVETSVAYAVTVLNLGPDDATSVVAAIALPDGVDVLSVGGAGRCEAASDGLLTCRLGSLPAGSSADVSVLVDVTSASKAVLSTTATVSTTSTDPVASNDASVATVKLIGRR
jgi:hypothetical protein